MLQVGEGLVIEDGLSATPRWGWTDLEGSFLYLGCQIDPLCFPGPGPFGPDLRAASQISC